MHSQSNGKLEHLVEGKVRQVNSIRFESSQGGQKGGQKGLRVVVRYNQIITVSACSQYLHVRFG